VLDSERKPRTQYSGFQPAIQVNNRHEDKLMHSKSLNACRKESRTLFLLQLVERALPDPPLRQPLTATPKKKNYFVVLLRELREYCIRE
jgi:hypothetical protein